MSSNDIVVSGMSGRFPMSGNVDEFAKNLFDGTDMVTTSEDRWPDGTLGITNRMGRMPNMDCFDANYFGIMGQMVDILDPQSRILLETTYEAIIDAGMNPQSIRGTKTGVYIGISKYTMIEGFPDNLQPDATNFNRLSMGVMGNIQSLYANRISFAFDFKGPSLLTDTACSASFSALCLAVNDLKLGNIDYAIVGGTQLTLQPYVIQAQIEGGLCSPRGVSAVLDESADGFVKADAIACILLQRRSTAKRVYANILSTKMNNDGRKTFGMFFPSSEAQENLMVEAYKEAGVDPLKLTYFEGHLTGTKVGDLQEVKAIYNAYCALPGRTEPLPLGMLKSNTGHTEGASGISALIKILLSYETERLAPNINLKQIKFECKEYCPPLYPNTEVLNYKPGLAGVNNFGIGGANVNVLVEPNYKLTNEDNLKIAETIPRLVNICGRTEEAVKNVFDFIENNPEKISRDFLALMTDTMKYSPSVNSAGFPFRGSMIIKKSTGVQSDVKYEYIKQMSEFNSKTIRPVWFLFPGLGGQWPAMAKALMPIKIFADKVEECHQILAEFGVNLKYLLLSEDKEAISTMTAKFCATTSIELALFELMKSLDIIPDGIIGHSFGEIACAYADGCLTTKQAMVVTYFRGFVTENDRQIPKGLMAVCGLTKAEAKKLIPPEVMIACNNSRNTVVLTGPHKQMSELIDDLKQKEIFCHQLESSDIPYHSKYLQTSAQPMIDLIKKYIPKPIKRSEKWISTSIQNKDSSNELLKYASAEYFVYNLVNPVGFYDKFKDLPSDAIVVEVGAHSVFKRIVKDTLENSTYLNLINMNSNETNLENFLKAIATLYELGLNPSIEKLYPKVEWPVSRGTPSISSLMKWDHRKIYERRRYPDDYNKSTSADMHIEVDISKPSEQFYAGHTLDGSVIFPATGYLMLVWRQFAATHSRTWNEVPVIFEQCQFRRSIFLSEDNVSRLTVKLDQNTGEFNVFEKDNLCAVGRVRSPTDDTLLSQHILHEKLNSIVETEFNLETDDIYKELRCIGYDYSGEFRGLKSIGTHNFKELTGICEWNGKVVTFLDSLLQSSILCFPLRKLMAPVMLKSIRIDPKVLMSEIAQNRIIEKQDIDQEQIDSLVGTDRQVDYDKQLETLKDKLQEEKNSIENRFCQFKSEMPFYFNANTKLLMTYGIEIGEIMAFPIPRRMETSNLVLDSYEFVANDDNNAIEENDRKNTMDYIEICKSMSATLKQMGLKELECDFNYQKISDKSLESYRQLNDENHIIFKILNKILEKIENENNNLLAPDQINSITNEFDLGKDMVNIVSKNERLIRTMTDIVCENYVLKREVSVTEINLTTDLLAKEVEQNISHYHVIPTFVDYKLIVKTKNNINETFAKNTIVWNSNEVLNLKPSDLIIFRDSFDFRSMDLKKLIQTFKDNINSNGFLLIISKYQLTEPEIVLNSIRTSDKILNNSDLQYRYNQFLDLLKETGLSIISQKSDSIGNCGLLVRKVEKTIKTPEMSEIIEITSDKYENWFNLIQNKLISIRDSNNKTDNVWLIANDTNINGILGLFNCLRLEPGGENLRCIFDFDCSVKQPIDWNSKPFSDILNNDLVINVIKDGKLGTYRHLKLAKDCNKVVSNEYFLNLGQTRDLSSLQWFDLSKLKQNKERYDIKGNSIKDVPVSIYSSGLTFKDVMIATGRIPLGQESLENDCLVGFELAGRRTDTGERVMGFSLGSFATSIYVNVDLITNIPDNWSMDEAITILSTYATVWYGLIEKASIKQGESILIHSGAGGVGQSAINVCKHYDCDIYVTVGTEEKKLFLINEYNIPENKIFSSRDIQFKQRIMELTNGKGVNIVLNSLTGEKLDASYDCLADGGRFVELGKVDMFQNKKFGMFDFLKDISFIGVAVNIFMDAKDFAFRFFDWMHKNCNNGCVKPINKTVFSANEAAKAFRYMTTGKHIGKIVIRMREEEINTYPMTRIKLANEMLCISKTYFDPNKVYIITGGLGGFGLELLHWMAFMGAKKFVLTSRSGLKTDYQKYIVNQMISYGTYNKYYKININVSKNDCMTSESTSRLLTEASQFGQIGGIFHSTLVLKDGLFKDMTFERLCEPIDAKYKVCTNLDVETRKLNYKLDYFVVFSSIACKGNQGQSNYAFGNSLCERICEQRIIDGLHGLAIQYGPIGDVGALESKDQLFTISSFQKQRINSCCDVLDKLLTINKPIVTSFVKSERISKVGNPKTKLVKELWRALGIDPETTPEHLTLGEIGLESMFAVELQQELERDYNFKISLTHIKMITIKMLKDYESGKMGSIEFYLDKVKKGRDSLTLFKFIIPKETHTRLNNVRTGKPIYFMPPFEITFSAFEDLAKKFDRPVIGLNWTKDMNKFETIKEITGYFMDLLKTLEPKGKYDLVGYFDGALVITKLLQKGLINKAVIVDIIDDKRVKEEILSDDFIMKFIFGFLSKDLPDSLKDKVNREINSEPDLNSKIRRIVSVIKDFVGRGLIATEMEEIFKIAVKRINILSKYMIEKRKKHLNQLKVVIGKKWAKKSGKIKFIKPFQFAKVDDPDELIEETRDLYLLPEDNETTDIITIEGLDFDNPFAITSDFIGNKILAEFK